MFTNNMRRRFHSLQTEPGRFFIRNIHKIYMVCEYSERTRNHAGGVIGTAVGIHGQIAKLLVAILVVK